MQRIVALALKEDVCLLGLRVTKGAELHLDILTSQLPLIQAAFDSGDFAVDGMAAPAAEEPKKAKK